MSWKQVQQEGPLCDYPHISFMHFFYVLCSEQVKFYSYKTQQYESLLKFILLSPTFVTIIYYYYYIIVITFKTKGFGLLINYMFVMVGMTINRMWVLAATNREF